MTTNSPTTTADASPTVIASRKQPNIEAALLTGGQDRPYAFGLAMALISKGVTLDVIGSELIDSPELHTTPNLRFLNLRGSQHRAAGMGRKVLRIVVYYARLFRYAACCQAKVFHILWNNKFEIFDRTFLMLYYKLLGKRIVLTAHNVNAARRDAKDSVLNRLSLRFQYSLADHIFVHTELMKGELVRDFGVSGSAITVLVHPINNAFPDTEITPEEAKRRLGLRQSDRVMLFFGRIQPYKGLEYLLPALTRVLSKHAEYKLLIAGEPQKGCEEYVAEFQRIASDGISAGWLFPKLYHIPDAEVEIYFKAADALLLPYKEIYQSGVLFLSLSFGLPVIASDVGSFRTDVIDGETGFLCLPGDPADLARAIEAYFDSDLYGNLASRREEIKQNAHQRHSWDPVAELTRDAYAQVLARRA